VEIEQRTPVTLIFSSNFGGSLGPGNGYLHKHVSSWSEPLHSESFNMRIAIFSGNSLR